MQKIRELIQGLYDSLKLKCEVEPSKSQIF